MSHAANFERAARAVAAAREAFYGILDGDRAGLQTPSEVSAARNLLYEVAQLLGLVEETGVEPAEFVETLEDPDLVGRWLEEVNRQNVGNRYGTEPPTR